MGLSSKGANNAPSDKAMTRAAGPWMPLQDDMKRAIAKANQVDKQGNWDYGPSAIADFDPATSWGIQSGIAKAQAGGQPLADAYNYVGGVARGGNVGVTPGQEYTRNLASGASVGKEPGSQYISDVATGNMVGNIPGESFIRGVGEKGVVDPVAAQRAQTLRDAMSGADSTGIDYLRGTASGNMLGKNPYIDQLVGDVTKDANRTLLPALEGRMATSGRLGSNAEGVGRGEIAEQLGQLSNQIRYTDYGQERGYMNQAQQALPGAELSKYATEIDTQRGMQESTAQDSYQRLAQQLQAAQQGVTNYGSGMDRALGASQQQVGNYQAGQGLALNAGANTANVHLNETNQALSAAGQLPGQYDAQFAPERQAIEFGNMNQAQHERQLQEDQARARYAQEEPYQRLQRLLGSYSAIGGQTNPGANAAMAQTAYGPSGAQVAIGNTIAAAGAVTGAVNAYKQP